LKIQTHKRHEELIAKWKSQIEQKAKAFENLQKKLAPPRDLEQLRLQIQEELDVPHQQKLKMFQEEVEKYRQSTFNLRRQFESLKSEYEHYAIDQVSSNLCSCS
jgi:type I site-specific restriction endonuclease